MQMNCPYCNSEVEVDHTEGHLFQEDKVNQDFCGGCEKYFTYTTSVTYVFYPEKADCLNGGDHDYKPTPTHPKYFTEMRCTICSQERAPTLEERRIYAIPTKADYLKSINK